MTEQEKAPASRLKRPLRKIVSTKRHPTITTRHIEVLECGHEQLQKTDIYGPTNAYARRCRQCAARRPTDD